MVIFSSVAPAGLPLAALACTTGYTAEFPKLSRKRDIGENTVRFQDGGIIWVRVIEFVLKHCLTMTQSQ